MKVCHLCRDVPQNQKDTYCWACGNELTDLVLKCDTCGSICTSVDTHSDIYGTKKDETFGQCPQCYGIGKFQIAKKEEK